MLTDDEMRERMQQGWRGGLSDGTVCGVGSTMESTTTVREWLPWICFRRYWQTLNDAGAGDRHWIRTILWHGAMQVRSFDLIPRAPDVVQFDITTQTMPPADVILCRHVANHLDDDRIGMALDRFRDSSRYLIATQFDEYDGSKAFTRVDLRKWLGDPIESVDDGGAKGCKLALWMI